MDTSTTDLAVYMNSKDLNSGSRVCVASTFTH